jgi:hypothetical protein
VIDADSLAALQRTFTAALTHDDPIKVRHQLLEAGWLDALDADEAACTAALFRIQGALCRDAAALDDIVARHLTPHWEEAAGEVAIAYPVPTGLRRTHQNRHLVLPAHRHANRLIWLNNLDGDLEIVDLDHDLPGRSVGGVDAAFGLLELSERPRGRLWKPEEPAARSAWHRALAAGRVALSHQLTSGARATLERAVSYAHARQQFNAPIGTFQAVKHRLAETAVAISSADAATAAAATSGNEIEAAAAKVLAGRAAAAAGRNCLQVFGGIGFTLEHDFHRYFRRSMVLDRLLGDPETLERQLGQQLRAGEIAREVIVNLDGDPRTAAGPLPR